MSAALTETQRRRLRLDVMERRAAAATRDGFSPRPETIAEIKRLRWLLTDKEVAR